MINKKASAPLVIGGISVGAIILLLFRLWATGLVINALEPELEKALNSLGENVVCPPEFSNKDYQFCISGKGDVILNGETEGIITIYLDSNKGFCTIKSGSYDHKKICVLDKINEANE
ncbi:MAG: hypothetical protein AABX66_02195 [Nanoarchaeota archaeon]